ncbi:hypothetical protein C7293_21730 [filamentous cyanobacterium CCT1]|nr:hypothetical protein C7293_21730 [filamentous cyanobacterium CCT1]
MHPLRGASQSCNPHPKSLSLGEKDFEIRLPFSPREKGLGDEGDRLYKSGIHSSPKTEKVPIAEKKVRVAEKSQL